MKLIYIYGPPAVGKLTVAQELQKLTGYKIFHNHLVLDMMDNLFESVNENYWELAENIRVEMLRHAAKENTQNLIKTECYSPKTDKKYIEKQVDILKKNNGEVCFVQLTASMKNLEKRVTNKSREKHNKMRNIARLRKSMEEHGLNNRIPFVKSLGIDTDKYSAKEAAKLIAKQYKLIKDEKA